ncbi:hypothetical protein S245_032727 [Arachis hypogaea]
MEASRTAIEARMAAIGFGGDVLTQQRRRKRWCWLRQSAAAPLPRISWVLPSVTCFPPPSIGDGEAITAAAPPLPRNGVAAPSDSLSLRRLTLSLPSVLSCAGDVVSPPLFFFFLLVLFFYYFGVTLGTWVLLGIGKKSVAVEGKLRRG